MSSQITPNSINQNYPVAGVDNNSQGFRDNFTSIKNNFTVTAREINDLMDKVVVKAPLTYGSTPSATSNNLADAILEGAVFKDCSLTTATKGTVTTAGTLTINYSDGSFQTVTLSGSSVSSTLAFSNLPPSGNYGELKLRVNVTDVTHTITLPAAISLYDRALSNYNHTTRVITFPSTGYYDLIFDTADAGGAIAVREVDSKPKPIVKYLTANAVTTSSSFAVVGNSTVGTLSFTALANKVYKFEAALPIIHSNSSTDTHSLAMNFSAGTCYYVVEQQAGPTSAFTANTATTSDSTASTVTTSNASAKFARITGTFTHTGNVTVSVSSKTSGNTFTVIQGASLIATQLGY
jgi:hypothetical protein